MKHTKGPWRVAINNAYVTSWLIMDSNGNQLAQVANWQNRCRNVDGEFNAKLMASAPDMVSEIARLNEAVKHIYDALTHIAKYASIPERDAEELADYVSGFLPQKVNMPFGPQ